MGIEHPGQCELASSVDHVVAPGGRKVSRLADRGNTAVLDDQRTIPDDPATRIYRDDVVDVGNDEARHTAQSSLGIY